MQRPLLALGLAATFALVGFSFLPTAENRVADPAAPDLYRHFTERDLAALGCQVAPGLGHKRVTELPHQGTVEIYRLQSETGCRISLQSQVQETGEGHAAWAGVRAEASALARQRGLELTYHGGHLGQRSEVAVFTQGGQPRGFSYTVQVQNQLRTVIIFSDHISPDARLEALLRRKV